MLAQHEIDMVERKYNTKLLLRRPWSRILAACLLLDGLESACWLLNRIIERTLQLFQQRRAKRSSKRGHDNTLIARSGRVLSRFR